MFKLALALCVVAASAADTEAPVISMEMASTVATGKETGYQAYHRMQCDKSGRKCYMVCDGLVNDRSHPDCAEPKVSAFDHHDGDLTSEITFTLESPSAKLVKDDEKWCSRTGDGAFGDIDFSELGTWVVTFKVSDGAGNVNSNSAEDQIYIHIVDNVFPEFDWSPKAVKEANCGLTGGADSYDLTGLHNTDKGDGFTTPIVDGKDPETVVQTYTNVATQNIPKINPATQNTMFKGVSLCPTNKGQDAAYDFQVKWEDNNSLLNGEYSAACGAGRKLYCGVGMPKLQDLEHVVDHTVTVKDTTSPSLDIEGFNTVFVECGSRYEYDNCAAPKGAAKPVCQAGTTLLTKDAVDAKPTITLESPAWSTLSGKWAKGFVPKNHANVPLKFQTIDDAGNKRSKTRNLKWQDTQAPVITWPKKYNGDVVCTKGNCAYVKECIIGSKKGSKFYCDGKNMAQPTCTDLCDADGKGIKKTSSKAPPASTWKHTNTYTQHWSCADAAGNTEKMSVIYKIVSHDVPDLELVSANDNYVAASYTGVYSDPGAECKISTTNLNHVIRTKGDVVDLSKPGDYFITYTCANPYNKAKVATVTRKVVVEDYTCPTLKINKQDAKGTTTCGKARCGESVTVEAGFPYIDASGSATDDFECAPAPGKSTKCELKKAGTGVQAIFHKPELKDAHLCHDVDGSTLIPQGGDAQAYCYKGKTYVKVESKQEQMKLVGNGCTTTRSGPTCESLNSEWKTPTCAQIKAVTKHFTAWGMNAYSGTTFNHHPCLVQDNGQDNHLVWMHEHDDEIASVGTYRITFTATDRAGNSNDCGKTGSNGDYIRTIVVKDTLPPVITLKAGNKYYNKKNAQKQSGEKVFNAGKLSRAKNPDYLFPFNPFALMAEQRSVNGWMVGALASFVAGIALISYSSKTESYSVPV
jgi:hypothetical protein